MKISSKGWAKKLDTLFSYIIRDRANWTCQKCSHEFPEEYSVKGVRKAQGLDTAHYKGRRLYATRWDLSNAIALCMGCHNAFGHDQWMKEQIINIFGFREHDRIVALHNSPPKWHKFMFQEKYDELIGVSIDMKMPALKKEEKEDIALKE